MPFSNPPITLFHGTVEKEAFNIVPKTPPGRAREHKIDPVNKCRPYSDFGAGFYTTSSRHQAEQWANTLAKSRGLNAAVLEFYADRERLAGLDWLAFVVDGTPAGATPFWDFVQHSRSLGTYKWSTNPQKSYDIVCGPLTIYPQKLIIDDADQYSFHTYRAVKLLEVAAASPVIIANPWF